MLSALPPEQPVLTGSHPLLTPPPLGMLEFAAVLASLREAQAAGIDVAEGPEARQLALGDASPDNDEEAATLAGTENAEAVGDVQHQTKAMSGPFANPDSAEPEPDGLAITNALPTQEPSTRTDSGNISVERTLGPAPNSPPATADQPINPPNALGTALTQASPSTMEARVLNKPVAPHQRPSPTLIGSSTYSEPSQLLTAPVQLPIRTAEIPAAPTVQAPAAPANDAVIPAAAAVSPSPQPAAPEALIRGLWALASPPAPRSQLPRSIPAFIAPTITMAPPIQVPIAPIEPAHTGPLTQPEPQQVTPPFPVIGKSLIASAETKSVVTLTVTQSDQPKGDTMPPNPRPAQAVNEIPASPAALSFSTSNPPETYRIDLPSALPEAELRFQPTVAPMMNDAPRPMTTVAATPPPGLVTAQSIARQIADQLPAPGGQRFELSLSPAELGSVKLRLIGTDSGSILIVQADRPETVDLMRRHISTLETDLRALGHEVLTVRFGGQGTGSPGGGMPGTPWSGQTQGEPADTASDPDTTPPPPSALMPSDHLDLRL